MTFVYFRIEVEYQRGGRESWEVWGHSFAEEAVAVENLRLYRAEYAEHDWKWRIVRVEERPLEH